MQWHGIKGNESWPAPTLVASSNEANRADQGNNILVCCLHASFTFEYIMSFLTHVFLKANEYLDSPEVLKAKVKLMAEMLRQSKSCCAYTGAGLSRSSGIPDYASKATNSVVNNVCEKVAKKRTVKRSERE